VQGFILKSDFINSEPGDKEDSREFYCKWLEMKVFGLTKTLTIIGMRKITRLIAFFRMGNALHINRES
jgi:hypothetical protein